MAELERTGELNMGFPISGVGRFRVSAMRQRGSLRGGDPLHQVEIPPLGNLGLPAVLGDLIMEKRGLLLMVGATGSGKSTTLASMIDSRNEALSGHILTIEDPVEFLFKNKRPWSTSARSAPTPNRMHTR
jgi:twitching motility protein PilU